MTVRIVLDSSKLASVTARIGDAMESRMAAAVLSVASLARSKVRRMFRGIPSLPGESPRRRSGELEASIQSAVVRSDRTVTGIVYADAPYGRVLEMGGSRVAARPFLRPSLAELWPRIMKEFNR